MDDESQSLAPSNAWMVVYVASSEPEAYVVAGRLQTEGIETYIHQESIGRSMGFSIGPLGEVKVSVRPNDYDRALTILDDDEFLSESSEIIPDDE